MGQVVAFRRHGGKPAPPRWSRWRKPQFELLLVALMIAAIAVQIRHLEPLSRLLNETVGASAIGAAQFHICGWPNTQNCVVDGDTIHYAGDKIRLLDIDAPEIHGYKCPSEKVLGERAKSRLLELMNEGSFELVAAGARDRDAYGRKLRRIMRHSQSLGDVLIAEGLASPWEGHHHYWCG
jgi:endonuclease YncB( thermonuclease family)